MAVLGPPSLTVLVVSVNIKPPLKVTIELRSCVKVPNSPYGLCGRKATFEGHYRVQELCEGPYGLCGRKIKPHLKVTTELRSCVKVELAVLGSTSLSVLLVSVDVKQHLKKSIETVHSLCAADSLAVLQRFVQCCITSTDPKDYFGLDGEPRTAISTFTQLLKGLQGLVEIRTFYSPRL